ncbi:dihydropteroate synthase [bacterium]|nr:dihydropteroate synthase [bacterium]
MSDFCFKTLNQRDIKVELKNIGFDEHYIDNASNKFRYINLKIFRLTIPQANILKQTALSVGADCAVNKGVLTNQVKYSDCILGGSYSQIKTIINKLKFQQFSMPKLAEELDRLLERNHPNYVPKMVGILNLTDNSFSDGGLYNNYESAVRHLNELIEDGADIIDIGAESTKPNSELVSADKQLEKIEPILRYISERNIKIPISIDTRSSVVAKRVCDYGIAIINDVSGFDFDNDMINVVAKSGVKVIIQHSLGTPENMQNNPVYENLIDDIYLNLNAKVKKAIAAGINQEDIIIDVGIGFGKTQEHNYELIKRIDEYKSLGCEIMLGISRKSFLNMQNSPNEEKDIYTLALNVLAIERKIDYLRVHNVKIHKKLIEIMKNFKEI